MYRMAIMACVLAHVPVEGGDEKSKHSTDTRTSNHAAIDPMHVTAIALVHDLAEAIVGDIAPSE